MRRALGLAVFTLAFLGAGSPPAFAGTIEGTVTPLDATQEVEVCLAEVPPGELCTVPKPDGSYVLTGLDGGYKIEFVPTYRSRLLTQFYDHKSTLAEATPVSVGKFGTVTGIDADLLPGGAIAGTVSGLGGQPLDEVEVCAASVGLAGTETCDETDSGGAYELHSLSTGSYTVGFWGHGASAEYAPEYFDGKASLGQASPVPVTAGSVTAEMDASLVKGAQIRGSVIAASGGAPLVGIPVCVFPAAAVAPDACIETVAGGEYSLVGLREGSYQVGFNFGIAASGGTEVSAAVNGYLPQYYSGATDRAAAQTLSLGPGQVFDGVNAALLEPSLPLPSPAERLAGDPLVAAAPPVVVPPIKKRCKRGFHKKKVKGKVRCVRVKPKKNRHRRGSGGER